MNLRCLFAFLLAAITLSARGDDKLLSVDPAASIIAVVREGQLKAFWIKPYTEITINGVATPLEKILPGMVASLSFSDGQTVSRMAIKAAAIAAPTPRSVVVKLFLDGAVTFRVRDGQFSIELSPTGAADQITVNGAEWKPRWKGPITEPLTTFSPPMEQFKSSTIRFRQLAGRAKMKMATTPAGNFEKIVTINVNDDQAGGEVYEFRLDW
jgi:hypothetical protein